MPVLLLFVALAEETERATDASYWLTFSGKQIVFGVVVGIVVGYLANFLITKSLKRNWMNDSFEDLSVLGISILAYAAADTIGGNRFIAAFCAGLTLGNIDRIYSAKTVRVWGGRRAIADSNFFFTVRRGDDCTVFISV